MLPVATHGHCASNYKGVFTIMTERMENCGVGNFCQRKSVVKEVLYSSHFL
jgi:hypothetical protein